MKSTKKEPPVRSTEFYVFAFGSPGDTNDLHNVKDAQDVGKLTDEERDYFYEEYKRRNNEVLDVCLIPKQSIQTDDSVRSRMLWNKVNDFLNQEYASEGMAWRINTAIDIINGIIEGNRCGCVVIKKKSQWVDAETEARAMRVEEAARQLEQIAKRTILPPSSNAQKTTSKNTNNYELSPAGRWVTARDYAHIKKKSIRTIEGWRHNGTIAEDKMSGCDTMGTVWERDKSRPNLIRYMIEHKPNKNESTKKKKIEWLR